MPRRRTARPAGHPRDRHVVGATVGIDRRLVRAVSPVQHTIVRDQGPNGRDRSEPPGAAVVERCDGGIVGVEDRTASAPNRHPDVPGGGVELAESVELVAGEVGDDDKPGIETRGEDLTAASSTSNTAISLPRIRPRRAARMRTVATPVPGSNPSDWSTRGPHCVPAR